MAAKKSAKKTARKSTAKKSTPKASKIPAVAAGKATPAPKKDDRLPAVGTVLTVTRGGKELTAKITVDGVLFNGKTYRSLSGAASAAAESVSLSNAQNGFVFWGIQKPVSNTNPVDQINAAFERIQRVLDRATEAERPHVLNALKYGTDHLKFPASKIAKAG